MIQVRKLLEIVGTSIIGFVAGVLVTRFSGSWYWLLVGFMVVLLMAILLSMIVAEPESRQVSFEAAMFLDPETGKMLHVFDPFTDSKTIWSDNWYYYTAYPYDVEVSKKKTIDAGGPTLIYEINNEAVTFLAEVGILGVLTGELFSDGFTVFQDIGQESLKKDRHYEVIPAPLDFDAYTVSGIQGEGPESLRWPTVRLPKEQLDRNPFLEAVGKTDFSGQCMFGEFIVLPLPSGSKFNYRHIWKGLPERWYESSFLIDAGSLNLEIDLFYQGERPVLDGSIRGSLGINTEGIVYRLPIHVTVKYQAKRWRVPTSGKKGKATVQWAEEVVRAIEDRTSFECHKKLWEAKQEARKQEDTGNQSDD